MNIETIGTKYEMRSSKSFDKGLKRAVKQGKDIEKLKVILKKLANKEPLEPKYKDHSLVNDKYYKDVRECHIEPDWLLIYQYIEDELILLLEI